MIRLGCDFSNAFLSRGPMCYDSSVPVLILNVKCMDNQDLMAYTTSMLGLLDNTS